VGGIAAPPWLQGHSLLPVVTGKVPEVNAEIFAELTFHAAYDPQRAIRTKRHKYIRRFGERAAPVLPNTDDSPSKDLLIDHGWGDEQRPWEQLHDLVFDPGEAANLVGDPRHAGILDELRGRLEAWMRETGDPLLDGPVAPRPGARLNDPAQRSPAEPGFIAGGAPQRAESRAAGMGAGGIAEGAPQRA
jgi:N-sulfoglucosamine sulfohydrolase